MTFAQQGGDNSLRRGVSRHTTTPSAPSAAASVPTDSVSTRDTVLDELAAEDAADNNAADDYPAARGDNLDTGDGARVDSAESNDDAADKEDNVMATVVQLTPGARY